MTYYIYIIWHGVGGGLRYGFGCRHMLQGWIYLGITCSQLRLLKLTNEILYGPLGTYQSTTLLIDKRSRQRHFGTWHTYINDSSNVRNR